MVKTRSGAASPAVSRVRQLPQLPAPEGAGGSAAAVTPLRPSAAHARGHVRVALQRAGFLALFCYLCWFVLILAGLLAYEGGCQAAGQQGMPPDGMQQLLCAASCRHRCRVCALPALPALAQPAGKRSPPPPLLLTHAAAPHTLAPNPNACAPAPPAAGEPILVKSRDLPLHWFDRLFRSLGSALLFALWGVRAAAARALPAHFDRRWNLVFAPAAIYAAQALIRLAIYQLHVAGVCLAAATCAAHSSSVCCSCVLLLLAEVLYCSPSLSPSQAECASFPCRPAPPRPAPLSRLHLLAAALRP